MASWRESVLAAYYYYYYHRLDIQNYGCNGNLLCYHGVVERKRISSLQRHGKALEKECCLAGVFCDSGNTPAQWRRNYGDSLTGGNIVPPSSGLVPSK